MSTKEKARVLFIDLQSKIMGEISHILRTVKLTSLLDLADESMTFTESANELEHFLNITHALAPMLDMTHKAAALNTYIARVKELGAAIDSGSDDALCEAIAKLDELPYT